MTKHFDEYGPYGENNPPVGVRPLDAEERQRAKEREEANRGYGLKPQKQLVRHEPSLGNWGDCYRTCVAVILGKDAKDVPHVCEKGDRNHDDLDGLIAMRDYLRGEGLAISKSVYSGDLSWAAFKKWMAKFNPDTAFIVTGQATEGTNHCVVCRGGRVVCNPSTGNADGDALRGPAIVDGEAHWWVEVILPLTVSRGAVPASQAHKMVEEEREACAKDAEAFCWNRSQQGPLKSPAVFTSHTWQDIGAAIRARTTKK